MVAKGLSALWLGSGSVLAARVLGPSGQGALTLLLTLAIFLSIVCSLGTNVVARRLLVPPADGLGLHDYLSLAVILTVVQTLLILGFGLLLRRVVLTGDFRDLLAAAYYGAATLATVLLLDILNAEGRLFTSVAVDAAGSALQLGSVVVLALGKWISVTALLSAYGTSLFAEVVCICVILVMTDHKLRLSFGPSRWFSLIRQSAPAASLSVTQTAAYRVDRYLLGLMRPPRIVGIYSVASTASEFLRLLPVAYGQFAFYQVATGTTRAPTLYLQRRVVVLVTAGIAGVGALMAPTIVGLALGTTYTGAIFPLRILLFANVANASYLVDISFLTAKGALAPAAVASLVGLCTVVALDLLLIPLWGEVGASWAILAAYCAMAASAHAFVSQAFRRSPI